ncbi:MAG: glutamate-cysteine ligase family protein [Thermoanaerobaculia bacterium]|nr:glutamate-cysteine ligase family protein [Thermoanaerobaculia bacterium]
MGETNVKTQTEPEQMRRFMQQVLDDTRALERMLREGQIERGVQRVGAEQEMFLVDAETRRPSMTAIAVLEAIDDPHFTTELAKFNMECNLDPFPLEAGCLRAMEEQLNQLLDKARDGARSVGAEIALIGILPNLEKGQLSMDSMTPVPRYYALADAMRRMRGDEFRFNIKGQDELSITHDNVMLEACNTSFQVHFQVSPGRFAKLYNIAQLVSAPVLAAAVFSPILFGRRLWAETRIALFQQAVDTRRGTCHHRQSRPRVDFGDRWVDDSVLDIFREDISHFRLLLTTDIDEDAMAALDQGKVPSLGALRLFNGTTYRWNRACYGVCEGRPHLRIENRVLPSGPTVVDEMANAAFWYGLVAACDEELEDVRDMIPFDVVKENFLAAARHGMKSQFRWIDGGQHTAQDLILKDLLPRAAAGLRHLGIGSDEIDRYIPVLEERARSLQTGSQWAIDSLAAMDEQGTQVERLSRLVAAAMEGQQSGQPVHQWPLASLEDGDGREHHYSRVGNLMSTDLFTVTEDEVIDLVASLMDWKYIHHVPVEDGEHRLVGLVTHRKLLRYLAQNQSKDRKPVAVREVMVTDKLITVAPDTPSLKAIRLMKEHRIACLPVVEDGLLVGIITERDFLKVADKLLEDFLDGPSR